jgi:hypothetical protein
MMLLTATNATVLAAIAPLRGFSWGEVTDGDEPLARQTGRAASCQTLLIIAANCCIQSRKRPRRTGHALEEGWILYAAREEIRLTTTGRAYQDKRASHRIKLAAQRMLSTQITPQVRLLPLILHMGYQETAQRPLAALEAHGDGRGIHSQLVSNLGER